MSTVYALIRRDMHEADDVIGLYATEALAIRDRDKRGLSGSEFSDYIVEPQSVISSLDLEEGDGVRLPSNEHGVILAVHKDKAWVLYDDMTPRAGLSFATVALTDLTFDPESRMIGVQNR
jgi:hypothetical protein